MPGQKLLERVQICLNSCGYGRKARANRQRLQSPPIAHFDTLERRVMLSAATWTGNAGDGQWSTADNWLNSTLPGSGSDVTIDAPAGTTIHGPSAGAVTVNSLTLTSGNLVLDGSNLSVTTTASISSGQSLSVNSGVTLTAASIDLNSSTLTLSGGTVQNSTITASGTGAGLVVATTSSGTLNDVTINANIDVTHANANIFLNGDVVLNGSMYAGATDGSTFDRVIFGTSGSSVMLSGNATIYCTSSYFDNSCNSNQTLTLAPTVTIQGRSVGFFSSNGATTINQGTISADVSGGTMIVGEGGYDYLTFENDGTLSASNGGKLNLTGTWTSSGAITASSGGVVEVSGTIDNTGNTLALNGSLTLLGGTISGGTVTETGTGQLVATPSGPLLNGSIPPGGILDGVTVNANIDVTQANGANVTFLNTIQLNGTLFIGATDGSTSGFVEFGNHTTSVTLSGNAAILLGSNSGNSVVNNIYGTYNYSYGPGGALTLPSTVSVTGNSGYFSDAVSGDNIVYHGGLTEDATGSIQFVGDLLTQTTNPTQFTPAGTVTLAGNGTQASPEHLEAVSQDLGATFTGLVNNSAYGTLALANNTYVQLVNQVQNTTSTSPEAVYTNTLVVPSGTTLDLNGLHLYAKVLQVNGSIVGGTVQAITSNGQIEVQSSSGTLTNGTGTVNFGTTHEGTPITQVITVTNNGNATLIVQPVTVPNGFSVVSGTNFTANQSIAVGASATFTIQLNATAVGTPGGTVTLASSDPTNGTFTFNVSGTVTQPVTGHAPYYLTVDNNHILDNVISTVANPYVVGNLQSYDVDQLLGPQTFTYVLGTGGDNSSFVISNGNKLTLAPNVILNATAERFYHIQVTSTESGTTNSLTTTLTLVVMPSGTKTHNPYALALAGNTIADNATAGTVVGTLQTYDVDSKAGPTTFTYSLGNGGDNAAFVIANGNQLALARGVTLDATVQPFYHIQVTSTESGTTNSLTSSLTVITTPSGTKTHNPYALALAGNTVVDTATPGTVVGTLQTYDVDSNVGHPAFTYTLGASGDNGDFTISGSQLLVLANAILNGQTKPYLHIQVTSTENGTANSLTTTFTVIVTHSGPVVTPAAAIAPAITAVTKNSVSNDLDSSLDPLNSDNDD